MLLALEKPS